MKTFSIHIARWFSKYSELMFWVIALLLLFFLPENKPAASFCFFSFIGLGHCPGCGIGHAIHYALHLHPVVSFQYHPLGIFAVLVIFSRIKQLITPIKLRYETQPHQHDPRH